jgi:hypothetical protein
MLKIILETALVMSITAVTAQTQTASKPEDGFLSTAKYTNAFFGFSLPLPEDADLRPLAEKGEAQEPFRHTLFGANSIHKGYPVIAILADEIGKSGNADPKKAVLALGAHDVDLVRVGGEEFSRGKWRADGIYRVAYAIALKGYVLYLCAFSFDKKVLDEFEGSIRQLTFFDPARAQEEAGPGSRPYEGLPPVPVSDQQITRPNTKPESQAAPKADIVNVPNPGMFYDRELDVHFNYPVEMQVLDAGVEMENGHLNIYGVSGENDPEHQQAKRCTRLLVDADLPQAKAPQRAADLGGIWLDDTKEYKESRKPEPVFGKILFMEIVRDCLPSNLQKNENDALGTIALSAVSGPGIQRMPKPIWYEVGKQKIHMNSGVGRPIVNGQLASAPLIVMSMSTQWRGHLLAWVFTSNDLEIFNEITKSTVRFGDESFGPMFAANIGPRGSGTPMTILPK